MITRLTRYATAMVAALGIASLLVGCGGGDEGPSTTSAPDAHQPSQPNAEQAQDVPAPRQAIAKQVPVFERAASSSSPDCAVALQVVHPALLPDPQGGESKQNCAAAISRVRGPKGFQATASKEFGTAAVVDGQASAGLQSLVWALDDQGNFKWTGVGFTGHQLDKGPVAGVELKRPVDAFLQALRDEDCKAAFAQLAPPSRLSYGGQTTFCAKFADSFTADAGGFGSRLQADPEARATELGTTHDLGFFGVATKPTGYRTVIVGPSGNGPTPKIIDVVPSTR